ncbi:hypothetical protein EWM62_11130 [Mucilaginibacter terrigena]|uniref:Glycosyl-4,4'-diaponeurosporenoate acyltransferase n=1 Tax=Mucilaginibacter terrigena TaxID=2492395 RepID=A0A4Q5LKK5_9SPHI|nr:hypothetical protein [Mucilaginibacter terrigena]RYU90087.1 hypothetical protein EWM62_11130 [Mucilaginibacter terrigena]
MKKRAVYSTLTRFNFISSDKINAVIGVKLFKLFLVKSFWRKLNPTLNIKQANLDALVRLRNEIISSEIIHLAAFITILLLLGVIEIANFRPQLFWPLAVINIITNLYPVLVQQYNKRRIIKMIRVFSNQKYNG